MVATRQTLRKRTNNADHPATDSDDSDAQRRASRTDRPFLNFVTSVAFLTFALVLYLFMGHYSMVRLVRHRFDSVPLHDPFMDWIQLNGFGIPIESPANKMLTMTLFPIGLGLFAAVPKIVRREFNELARCMICMAWLYIGKGFLQLVTIVPSPTVREYVAR